MLSKANKNLPRLKGFFSKFKSKNTSIKWKLFYSFILFSLILLMLLWFFQTVFLETFYQAVKASSIKKTAEAIAENIDHPNLQTLVDRLSEDNDTHISIVGENGKQLIMQTSTRTSQIQPLFFEEFFFFFNKAESEGGSYLEQFTQNDADRNLTVDNDSSENTANIFVPEQFQGQLPFREKTPTDQISYALLVQNEAGNTVMILAKARLSPVSSTISTLRLQLIIVSAAMIMLSLILALLQSKRIARPIEKINIRSRELAAGNYNVTFEAEGYKEITQLSRTLNQMTRDLEQVENLRKDLIANVSHDLRTPLTMIRGYAEVMRDLPGENNANNIQIIIEETSRLTELVNDLLDLSKLQSGKQKLDCEIFCLSDILTSLSESYRQLCAHKGYKIETNIEPKLFVNADRRRMEQVISNLMSNALNYTGSDLSVSVKACKNHINNTVRVEIRDTGKGISKDQINHIWERYYRSENSNVREVSGSGLGLSIVRQILEHHNSSYGIDRPPEGGSIFWFEMPLIKKP